MVFFIFQEFKGLVNDFSQRLGHASTADPLVLIFDAVDQLSGMYLPWICIYLMTTNNYFEIVDFDIESIDKIRYVTAYFIEKHITHEITYRPRNLY